MSEGADIARAMGSVAKRVLLPGERLDLELMQAEATVLAGALERFRSANAFLRAMEEAKGERGGLDSEEEREALARAAGAAVDCRTATRSIFRCLRQLRASGVLEALMHRHRALVEDLGSVRLSELWSAVAEKPGVRTALQDYGLSEADIDRIEQEIGQSDMRYRLNEGTLLAEAPDGSGDPIPIMVERKGGSLTAEGLWRHDILTAAIAALDEPGPLGLEVFRAEDFGEDPSARTEPLDPVEMLLAHCSLAVQETEAFAESVSCGGLPTIRGGDPWFWIVIGVAAAAVAIAGAVITIICWASDDFEEDHPDLCDAASWLTIIGVLLVIGSSCGKDDSCKIHVTIRTKGEELLSYDGSMGPIA